MAEFFKTLSLDKAREVLRSSWPLPGSELCNLQEILGRSLAADLIAQEEHPSFERSTVDGYAVLAADTFGASETLPAFLSLIGEIVMGNALEQRIESGQCLWIPTGGMLPAGADAVVMVEYTEKLDRDLVLVSRPAAAGENVIYPGEDCRVGDIIFRAGHVMRPQDIGVCAALGISRLEVLKPLSVGVISTGDEIVDIDVVPRPGQVRDVNSYVLAAGLQKYGVQPAVDGVIPDSFDRLREAVVKALNANDLLIISGGSSVGTRDMSLEVLGSLPDSQILFHGISIKPGKPTLAVRVGSKLVIGLPGHPVSALMVFEVLLGNIIAPSLTNRVRAILADNVASQAGRDDFVRIKIKEVNGDLQALPVYGKAGLIIVMSEASGFVHIPGIKQGLNKGEAIEVVLF